MGRLKEELLNNMSEEDYLVSQSFHDEWMEYEEWKNSDDYVKMINDEFAQTWPIYSEIDVEQAITYALSAVQVTSSEVGHDVYGKLVHEKVFEYLNTVR